MWELGQILNSDSEVLCPNFEQEKYMCKSKHSLIINGKKKMDFTEWLYCLQSLEHVTYIFLFAEVSKIQLMGSMASFCFTCRITPFSVVFSSHLHVQICWTGECLSEYLKTTNSLCVCVCVV